MDIHRGCLLNAINVDMQWIPRDLNSAADDTSKFINYDDYMINGASSVFVTTYGVHIPAIGSLVPTMPNSSALIQGFTSLVRVVLMHFLRIGLIIITGCVPLCI